MKKTTKFILGILAFVGLGILIFFVFLKDKVTGTTTNTPLTGNSANNEISVLSDKIKALETKVAATGSGNTTSTQDLSTLRTITEKFVELAQKNVGTIVINVLDYDLPVVNNVQEGENNTEGTDTNGVIRDVSLVINPTSFPLVSPVVLYPIYKFLNAPCNLTITLGSSNTPFYSTSIVSGDIIYPKLQNGTWTYFKA